MKVALVHLRHRHTGGTERYLNQVASHLAELGHPVTVVCRTHEGAPHPAVRFVELRSPAVGTGWRTWAFARDVARHVQRADYDLVFALGRTWSQDLIRLGGGCHATHLAADGRRHRHLEDHVVLAIERRALAAGAYRAVVTNSEMVRRDVMARYGVPEELVTVIQNGVDPLRFDAARHTEPAAQLRAECGFAPGDLVLLFLGTGYRRKGLDRLLEAFPHVHAACPETRLLVVGDDSSPSEFRRQAERLGIHPWIRFLGPRRDPEICFAAADLYVLPTRYDPFANSTLEALSSSLPVITTSTNGASEIVPHHEAGSILETADPRAICNEIVFWSQRERRDAGSRAARRIACAYSEKRAMLRTTALLERLHGGRRAAQ